MYIPIKQGTFGYCIFVYVGPSSHPDLSLGLMELLLNFSSALISLYTWILSAIACSVLINDSHQRLRLIFGLLIDWSKQFSYLTVLPTVCYFALLLLTMLCIVNQILKCLHILQVLQVPPFYNMAGGLLLQTNKTIKSISTNQCPSNKIQTRNIFSPQNTSFFFFSLIKMKFFLNLVTQNVWFFSQQN